MMPASRASVATLVVFLKCFVIFTIAMGLAVSFGDGWPPGLVSVVIAVVAGGVLASLVTLMVVVRLRRRGVEPRLWGSVRHGRTVTLPLSGEETVRLAERAARSWRWKVRRVDADGRKMTVAVPMSWQSWGERVTVTARPTDTGCEVAISSRPVLPSTLVDSGANVVNVRRMAAFLTEHATGPVGDPPGRT